MTTFYDMFLERARLPTRIDWQLFRTAKAKSTPALEPGLLKQAVIILLLASPPLPSITIIMSMFILTFIPLVRMSVLRLATLTIPFNWTHRYHSIHLERACFQLFTKMTWHEFLHTGSTSKNVSMLKCGGLYKETTLLSVRRCSALNWMHSWTSLWFCDVATISISEQQALGSEPFKIDKISFSVSFPSLDAAWSGGNLFTRLPTCGKSKNFFLLEPRLSSGWTKLGPASPQLPQKTGCCVCGLEIGFLLRNICPLWCPAILRCVCKWFRL